MSEKPYTISDLIRDLKHLDELKKRNKKKKEMKESK